MTDKYDEQAEKLITDMDCDSCQCSVEMRKQMTALAAGALREAVEEERRYWQEFMKLNKFEYQSEYRKACYADAARIVQELLLEKQKCSSLNHDDRWCPTCEAMEDAYVVAEDKIRARAQEVAG